MKGLELKCVSCYLFYCHFLSLSWTHTHTHTILLRILGGQLIYSVYPLWMHCECIQFGFWAITRSSVPQIGKSLGGRIWDIIKLWCIWKQCRVSGTIQYTIINISEYKWLACLFVPASLSMFWPGLIWALPVHDPKPLSQSLHIVGFDKSLAFSHYYRLLFELNWLLLTLKRINGSFRWIKMKTRLLGTEL